VTGPGAGGSGTDAGNGVTGTGAGLANSAASAVAGSGSANCSGGTGGVGTPGSGGNGQNAHAGASSNGGGGGGGWVGGSGGGAGDCPFGNASGAGGGGGAGASFAETAATGVSVTTAGSTAPEVIITATIVVPQTISFMSTAPSGATVGGPTYTVMATGGASGNPVMFTIDPSSTSGCSVAGSVVSFPGPPGSCVIDANQAGNADYFAASQAQQSFAVAPATQILTFVSTPPPTATVGGPNYTVMATGGGSGNPVVFSIDPFSTSGCMIVGAVVTFPGSIGTCVIDANQAGNSDYLAAPQAQQSFSVGPATQVIAFVSTPPPGVAVGYFTYTVTAAGGASGNPVTFTIDPSSTSGCLIAGAVVSFPGPPGSCVIDANQAGNTDYLPATRAQQSFTVGAGSGGGGCLLPFPRFTSPSTIQVVAGKRFAVHVTSAGCPMPSVKTPNTLPKYVRFLAPVNGSAVLVGTAKIPVGTYVIILTAVNSDGTATQDFMLVITAG